MALINFLGVYQKMFSSFNVSADVKLVEQLEADGVKKLMIIKRSWIFGVFISWIFGAIFLLMLVNSYLIYLNFGNTTAGYILIGLLFFNIIYWIVSIFIYFKKFRRIYGERSRIMDISILKNLLKEGDIAFAKFFNQTIFNYFILIGLTIYIVYDMIFGQIFSEVGIYGVANIILLFLQIILSAKFKNKMTNLEMDFSIIVPGKIIFYNQSGILRNILTINSEKIKTITSNFSNYLGSIFNFGEIVVMTEGDEPGMGEMRLYFISSPSETVYEINEILGMSTNKGE